MVALALYQPDIAQNAGTAARLCACLGIRLHIIEPCGFDASDRNFRRAGMDYLDRACVERHISFAAFIAAQQETGHRLVLATTKGADAYTRFAFGTRDTILMGRESAGVPPEVHDAAQARIVIPMAAGLRSINVAVAAGMIVGEALRQTAWLKE